jgi:hypothetical protein
MTENQFWRIVDSLTADRYTGCIVWGADVVFPRIYIDGRCQYTPALVLSRHIGRCVDFTETAILTSCGDKHCINPEHLFAYPWALVARRVNQKRHQEAHARLNREIEFRMNHHLPLPPWARTHLYSKNYSPSFGRSV